LLSAGGAGGVPDAPQVARSFGEEVWRLSAIEVAYSLGMILGGLLMAWWRRGNPFRSSRPQPRPEPSPPPAWIQPAAGDTCRQAHLTAASIPLEGGRAPVLGHPAFEEGLLRGEVDVLLHSGEGVGRAVLSRQPRPRRPATGAGMAVPAEHGGAEAVAPLGQHLLRVPDLQLHRPADRLDHPLLEGGRPQLGVLRLDAVDQVHAEGEVDRLVPQDVLELLTDARHPVPPVE